MKLTHPRYVLVSCFDEPEKLVDVDCSLIESVGCRLWLLIKNSEPEVCASGKLFYRAGSIMTRSMLVTFLRSLSLGELSLSKGVTIGEALKVFHYEGVDVGGKASNRVDMPSHGIAFSKRDLRVSEAIDKLCSKIADAIVQWPRLESTLDAPISESEEGGTSCFTATATRAWVRFAGKPHQVQSDGDAILALATQQPRWLSDGLVALGMMLVNLSYRDASFLKLRDEEAFKKLWGCVEDDPLGCFFGVKMDFCKASLTDKTRSKVAKAEKFANEVRSGILNNSPNLAYYRAAVMSVDYVRRISPLCARLFNGACADDSGNTPERSALKKALKMRGVNVVRWQDSRDPGVRPLVFPPSWSDRSNSSCYGPSMLLSFENLL